MDIRSYFSQLKASLASTYLGPWCNQTEIHEIPTLVLGLTGTLTESRQICSLGTIFFLTYQESGFVSLNEGFSGYEVIVIVKNYSLTFRALHRLGYAEPEVCA